MFGVALVGGILSLVGVFLPWLQIGALLVNRGIDNPDGAIFLGVAIVACAIAAFGLWRKTRTSEPGRPIGVLLILIAIGLFWIGLVDLQDVQGRIRDVSSGMLGDIGSVGSGLYMILAGAVILGVGGLGATLSRRPARGSSPLDGA